MSLLAATCPSGMRPGKPNQSSDGLLKVGLRRDFFGNGEDRAGCANAMG